MNSTSAIQHQVENLDVTTKGAKWIITTSLASFGVGMMTFLQTISPWVGLMASVAAIILPLSWAYRNIMTVKNDERKLDLEEREIKLKEESAKKRDLDTE